MLKQEKQKVYRLAPCPSYDIEGMEGWLTDLAREGLLLEKDGFWGGLAVFSRSQPQPLKYRLEAAQTGTSMWAENNGEPDPGAVELSQAYHWEYLAKRGDFYIYCSKEPGERELNTDPLVQALALKAVRKRRIGSLIPLCFWLLVYLFLAFFMGPLLLIITARSWFFLWGTALIVWVNAESVSAVISLGRLQRRLDAGQELRHTKDWQGKQKRHLLKRIIQVILFVAWIVVGLAGWSRRSLGEDRLPLTEYQKELPFATMKELAGEEIVSYQGSRMGGNYDWVKEWSDWLAPGNIHWSEHADIRRKDGSSVRGGLLVDYHKTANAWIAKRLAAEYEQYDRFKRGIWDRETLEYLDLPSASELGVETAVGYWNQIHFPTVVLQKGNQIIHATFYQVGEEALSLEEWVRSMAERLSEQ